MKRTIIDASQLELTDKVVTIKRVTKTVKGGRNMRFTALVVVGDGNGHVGAGLGKAVEIPEAIRKGKEDAIKNLIKIAMDENNSITHDYIELVPHDYPEYTCSDEIYNNVEKDGYFYFRNILESEENAVEHYNVITKVKSVGKDVEDLINPDKDYSQRVRVSLGVDCVQYNRVSELWKMNKLPWW